MLKPLWFILTIDRMTKAGTTPMATYPSNSTSLYLQVENWDMKRQCLQFSEQLSLPTVWCKHLRTGVWFQVNCVKPRHRSERDKESWRYLSWKKKTYMDPIQAMTQINQRMWHAQGPSSLSINLVKHITQTSLQHIHQLGRPTDCF